MGWEWDQNCVCGGVPTSYHSLVAPLVGPVPPSGVYCRMLAEGLKKRPWEGENIGYVRRVGLREKRNTHPHVIGRPAAAPPCSAHLLHHTVGGASQVG